MQGVCIVVTPLIALMKDQVEHLLEKDIQAFAIHSGLQPAEIVAALDDAAEGKIKFLYISPERIDTPVFQDFLQDVEVCLIAVDEAHCISQWGYDFRPAYLKIARLRLALKDAPVIALTASATEEVQKDIIEKLYFRKFSVFRQSFERKNLSYSSFKVDNKIAKLTEICKNVAGSAIVYCKSRRLTQDVAAFLNAHKLNADFYHAGLEPEVRALKQEQWMNGDKRIMVCTNAFGMGIDKPDVRVVVHHDMPDCLENYYQEAGRAGRDGNKSYAVLLYTDRDITELKNFVDIRFPAFEVIKKTYGYIADFLHLPSGTGEGLSFDFDFVAFVENFKLDTLQTMYAIKAIEQQGHFQLNDSIFLSSKVQFIADRDNIEAFEDAHEALEPIIKVLLRTYEGIFSKTVSINEERIARKLHISEADVFAQLKQLHALRLIQYIPQKDNPQLLYLMNRSKAEDMFFNHSAYLSRKEKYNQRLAVMLKYAGLQQQCRSAYISAYFGDEAANDCGVCDNCLNKNRKPLSKERFDSITSQLLDVIRQKPATITQLLAELKHYGKTDLWKVIRFLQAEKTIRLDSDGRLHANRQ